MILFSDFYQKKPTTFKNMSLQFSINSSKYVHFWTLVIQEILILANLSFWWYISCRHFNFDPLTPTYENGHQGNFPQFWRSRICVFCGLCHIYFLWTQKFLWDSITALGLRCFHHSLRKFICFSSIWNTKESAAKSNIW